MGQNQDLRRKLRTGSLVQPPNVLVLIKTLHVKLKS